MTSNIFSNISAAQCFPEALALRQKCIENAQTPRHCPTGQEAYGNLFRKLVSVVKVRTVGEQTLRSPTPRSFPETPKNIRNEYVSKSCWPWLSARERQRVGVRTTKRTFEEAQY